MKSSFALAVLFAGYAAAQSSSAASAMPSGSMSASAASPSASASACVIQCATTAAKTAGCSSYTEASCVCTNAGFQQAAATCIQSTCPSAASVAAAMQQSLCGNMTLSSTTTHGTATSAASATHSGNAAAGLPVFNAGAGIWTAVALGGAAIAHLML